jgi:nucleoside-diphosphate-sugar epimerase
MQRETMAIVGFGDLGERLVARLAPARWRCVGLRRNIAALPAAVKGVAVDFCKPASLQILSTLKPEVVVIALTPAQRSAAGYRAGFADAMSTIVNGLGGHRPRQAFFVSSTRVYSESDGGWIDEDSPVASADPFTGAILAAESRLLDALPGAVVLRAAGLYGHGPGPLLKRVAAGRLTPLKPLKYSNRIHRDDVAGFINHCLAAPPSQRIINLVDDAAVAQQEVEAWLCSQLKQAYRPAAADPDPAALPAHKRIRNRRLHDSGFALQYPDYRAGYTEVLHRWMVHSEREDGLDLH